MNKNHIINGKAVCLIIFLFIPKFVYSILTNDSSRGLQSHHSVGQKLKSLGKIGLDSETDFKKIK